MNFAPFRSYCYPEILKPLSKVGQQLAPFMIQTVELLNPGFLTPCCRELWWTTCRQSPVHGKFAGGKRHETARKTILEAQIQLQVDIEPSL